MGNNLEFRPLGKTSESIPEVGMGTWGMGGGMRADSSRDSESIEALKLGLELDMTLVDTAERYGAGHSEEVVSRALEDWRKPVFVASKVSPSHFGYEELLRSARKSLDRLRVKQMDLYQLHWPNPRTPITETMKAMEKLTLIAYSPLGQGRIARGRGGPFKIVDEIAARLGKSRSQVALNWLLQHESVVVIPKAGDKKHVVENAAVSGSKLSTRDFQEINKAFR